MVILIPNRKYGLQVPLISSPSLSIPGHLDPLLLQPVSFNQEDVTFITDIHIDHKRDASFLLTNNGLYKVSGNVTVGIGTGSHTFSLQVNSSKDFNNVEMHIPLEIPKNDWSSKVSLRTEMYEQGYLLFHDTQYVYR